MQANRILGKLALAKRRLMRVDWLSARRRLWHVDNLGLLNTRQAIKIILRSGLFDTRHYVKQLGNVEIDERGPIRHYLEVGELKGYTPNRFFDPAWYRKQHRELLQAKTSPLLHYLLIGWQSGLATSADFDPSAYLKANPDLHSSQLEPLSHFLRHGAWEGRQRSNRLPSAGGWFGIMSVHDLGTLTSSGFTDCKDIDARVQIAQGGAYTGLHIMHRSGGGAERAVAELIRAKPLAERHAVVMLAGHDGEVSASLILPDENGRRRWDFRVTDFLSLSALLRSLDPSRVIVHQPSGIIKQLKKLITFLGVPYEIYMHDYTLICPRNSFVQVDGQYCGEPEASGCEKCLRLTPLTPVSDIQSWRTAGVELMRGAEIVRCHIEDTAQRLKKYVPDLMAVVAPLQTATSVALAAPKISNRSPLRVAVIGRCSTAKGGDFLLDCITLAQKARAPIEWHVVGSFVGANVKRARNLDRVLSVTGEFDHEQLSPLIRTFQPHLIMFPQRCVETWSYALTEAVAVGVPILAANLGPFAERLSGVHNAYFFDVSETAEKVVSRIIALRAEMIIRNEDYT